MTGGARVGGAADMMVRRRSALDRMAEVPAPEGAGTALAGMTVALADHVLAPQATEVPATLVRDVVDRLLRDPGRTGAGAALVTGLEAAFDLPQTRRFHEVLFRAVWEVFRTECDEVDATAASRIKTGVTEDGSIPLEQYGSAWSFKRLHMDRDAMLFSHLYGPVAGFAGGEVLLADVRGFMRRHHLRFDDLFEWSVEPTPGSKPVLRQELHEPMMREFGVDLGALGPDAVVFVNNAPGAGILHGVRPVVIEEGAEFVRVFHRCSAKTAAPSLRATEGGTG
ncbi:hypothetical protein [Streptomyces sp. NPDC127098]|uniref:hypothetical protein n=1 Tax=Streptomyces sp. NPDC127098 TaxID=3347137 RepID=UPI0036670F04